MLATDLRTYAFDLEVDSIDYRSPMKFGGRVVEGVQIVSLRCRAENGAGQQGDGLGSMTMGNAWAWPSQQLTSAQTLEATVALAKEIAEDAAADPLGGHPLDISLALAERRQGLVERVTERLGLPERFPPLAVLLAASPLEAALFDAHGKAVGQSAFALLGPDYLPRDLGTYLGKPFAGLSLQQFVSPRPVATLPLYHLVGALDPLVAAEVTTPVGDGLPETLAEWIPRDGLSHLKIKLAGDDLAWDVERVRAVNATAEQSGQPGQPWAFSLDFNERCQDADYVLAMLDQVAAVAPSALPRIQYIEQPTHRDLAAHPENTMHRVAERLPVVIDESLVDLDSLYLAREQGYSGVALKACKGHAEALLMGAAAQHLGMYLCVQDLTCIGASFLHSASLSARIPTIAAIEGNGRQYCPAGNAGWDQKYPGMFQINDGTVETACLVGNGLY